jgi:hypothetical protein
MSCVKHGNSAAPQPPCEREIAFSIVEPLEVKDIRTASSKSQEHPGVP